MPKKKPIFSFLNVRKLITLTLASVLMVGAFYASKHSWASTGVTTGATVEPLSPALISIDTTKAQGGSGTFTNLGGGPVIREMEPGQIAAGEHTIVLPAGWEFSPANKIRAELEAGTDLRLKATSLTPGKNSFTFTVKSSSHIAPAVLRFSGLAVRPTGKTIVSGSLAYDSAQSSGIAGVGAATDFGFLQTKAGLPRSLAPEEAQADGGFLPLGSRTLVSDDSFEVFAVRRDRFGNFVDVVQADWSLINASGGVSPENLSGLLNCESTLFRATLIGSGRIQASSTSLTGRSGTITVVAGLPGDLEFLVEPAIGPGATTEGVLSVQPVLIVTDGAGNPVADGTIVTVSRDFPIGSPFGSRIGDGNLYGTLSVPTKDGIASFTDLGYDRVEDSFNVIFAAGSETLYIEILGPSE